MLQSLESNFIGSNGFGSYVFRTLVRVFGWRNRTPKLDWKMKRLTRKLFKEHMARLKRLNEWSERLRSTGEGLAKQGLNCEQKEAWEAEVNRWRAERDLELEEMADVMENGFLSFSSFGELPSAKPRS